MTREGLLLITQKGRCKVVSGLHERSDMPHHQMAVNAAKQSAIDNFGVSSNAKTSGRARDGRSTRPAPTIGAPSEHDSQCALIRWWSFACKDYSLDERTLIAHPLQSNRGPINGAKMKREGLRKGTLDLQLIVQSHGCLGLWIEMKSEKGRLSKAQKEMRAILITQGYPVEVCHSTAQAVAAITNYLTP